MFFSTKFMEKEDLARITDSLGFAPSKQFLEELFSLTELKTLSPGEFFCQAGDQAKHMCLVLEGMLRGYYLRPDGKCSVYAFFGEGHVGGPYLEIRQKGRSRLFIDSLERSRILVVDFEQALQQNKKSGEWLLLRKNTLDRAFQFLENRVRELLLYSSQERVERLTQNRPDLFHRVRHLDLASYLNMTPETFSRNLNKINRN